ncbi:MAG: winged helix-turn-helix transcriptional regulator [Bacteriovoracaceae bacterium]|nr:winged helix-turn-helix transcriptional regulator [Bacteriovoracaceae bacterium]
MKACEKNNAPIHSRPLISLEVATDLTKLFKILTSDTRLRLLHALARKQELCVNDLAKEVDMKPQAVSNQLQRLVNCNILACKRNGTEIHYRILDPCVITLLELGLCLLAESKK